MSEQDHDGPPKGLIAAALVVAVATVITVLGVAASRQQPDAPSPVRLAGVPAPEAGGPECTALVDALPEHLGDYSAATIDDPAPEGAAAWQAEPNTEPVVLRCGLDRPLDFVAGVPLQQVDAVQWFQVSENPADAGGRGTWFAVDRPVYVALTLPPGSGPTPIQQLSGVIAQVLPAVTPEPAAAG
ncbi:MAG: DUF3515 domain-containing protein [Mycobacterium sp.]